MKGILLALVLSLPAAAQIKSFQYLGEDYWAKELYLGVATRYLQLEAPQAPQPEAHRYGAWTGDLQLYRSAPLKYGAFRYMLRNKLLGEIFLAFGDQFNEVTRSQGSTMSHFLLGSHSLAWNSYLHENFTLALGFNLSDLLIGSTWEVADSMGNPQRLSPSPHGWYLGAGPSLFLDYSFYKYLLVELQIDYILHYSNPVPLSYGEAVNTKSFPQQAFISLNLMTSAGLYLGLDYTMLWDTGPRENDLQKIEAVFGFKVML